jgi:hypothetical protein
MKHHLRDVIGSVLIAAFVLAVFALFWKAIPTENEQLVSYMLGQLSGFAAAIVAFHYAANAQSQEATANTGRAFEAMTEQAKATQAATAAAPEEQR